MHFHETRMGEGQDVFPETTWGTILGCTNPESPGKRRNLDRLFQRYWRPVYSFIRKVWKKPVEDAKDLAQGFFCHVLETQFLVKTDREKGRFRDFLRAALRNYLAEVHRGERAVKRGGGQTVLPLDELIVEKEQQFIDDSETADDFFNRQWSSAVFDDCLSRLKEVLALEGKEDAWRVYEAYELPTDPTKRTTYEQVARNLGLSPAQVRGRLDLVRERLHQMIVRSIRDTVASPEDLTREMSDLFSC